MSAKINLLNQSFGKLIVIEETNKRKNNSVVWKCKCSCGNIIELSTKELRSDGYLKCFFCGNEKTPNTKLLENIIGKRYGSLTVLEKTDKVQSGKILYKCLCDCGNITEVSRTDLKNKHTKSCGCAKRKYKKQEIINNRLILEFLPSIKGHAYYKVKCLFCNREYQILGEALEKTFSCGCQKSKGEYNILQILESNKINFIKEYSFSGSKYRFDFAILNQELKIIRLIEFDGEQHFSKNIKNSGWNTKEHYFYTKNNDIQKNILAKENKIPLVRIPYWERENITLEILFSEKYLVKETNNE